MTNLLSTTEPFITAVDHAAGMNDRWLFLAAFCLLLVGCGRVIWWLVRRLEIVIGDHKQSHLEHQEALTKILGAQNDTALRLAVCLDRNSQAMHDCTDELRRVREGR